MRIEALTTPPVLDLLGTHRDPPEQRYEVTIRGRVIALDYLGEHLTISYETGRERRRYVLRRLGDQVPAGAAHVASVQTLHLYDETEAER